MKKIKPFISRAAVLNQIKQYCELNKIDFEKNILNNSEVLAVVLYSFHEGTWVGRNGNKTFQDATLD